MDATQLVIQAINGWLQSLAASVTPSALKLAGGLVLQTSPIPSLPGVQPLWSLAAGVADVMLVLALMGGGILVMSAGTFEHLYTTKRMLPRLALAAILSNASLALCAGLIQLDNSLVTALIGPDPQTTLWAHVSNSLVNPDQGTTVLSSLLAIAVAIIAVLLVVVYLARDVLLVVGTVMAPLALVTSSLPVLSGISSLWMRAYAITLFVQVPQAVLLSVGLQVVQHPDRLGLPALPLLQPLALVTLLYVSLRLPFVAYRLAFGGGITSNAAVQTAIATGRSALGGL